MRCFELVDHGYYTEALINAFAILDDQLQQVLHQQFANRGLEKKRNRDSILRGIKDHRMAIYFGPLFKLVTGRDFNEFWPKAFAAIEWINGVRNRATHAGYQAKRSEALTAIYVAVRLLVTLEAHGVCSLDFDKGLKDHTSFLAMHLSDAQPWVEAM